MPKVDLSRKALRQFELNRRAIKQAAVAERSGVSEATVSRVIAGIQRHHAVEIAIAELTGLPREMLFPEPTADVAVA